MAMITDHQKRRVMECPVCLELLEPPIIICVNGHGTCQMCRNSMNACGVCRAAFSKIKNTLLNEMIESVSVKCCNESEGCDKCSSVAEIKKHEKECLYRKVECFVCEAENICLTRLNDHFIEKHKDDGNAFDIQKTFNSVSITSIPGNMWIEEEFTDLYKIVYVQAINIHFLVRFLFVRDKHILYVYMQFLGNQQEEAENYMYDVKINQGLPSANRESFYTCTGFCIPYYYKPFSVDEAEVNERVIRLNLKSIFLKSNKDYLKEFAIRLCIRKIS